MTGGDTAYVGVGYPTPTTTSSPGTGPGATGYGSTGESSTTDVVKVQASQVGQEAVAGGQHVAGVAAEQTKNVASEAGAQAQNLLSEARSQLSDQAAAQQNNLASWLPDLATELGSMVDRSDASDAPSGTATGLARQASGRAHSVAGWLEDHEPADVLAEVSRFARQRPGMFLALAAVGGLLAGRLTRGLTSDRDCDPGTSTTSTTSSTSTTSTTMSAAPAGDRYTPPPVTPSVSSPAEGMPAAALHRAVLGGGRASGRRCGRSEGRRVRPGGRRPEPAVPRGDELRDETAAAGISSPRPRQWRGRAVRW